MDIKKKSSVMCPLDLAATQSSFTLVLFAQQFLIDLYRSEIFIACHNQQKIDKTTMPKLLLQDLFQSCYDLRSAMDYLRSIGEFHPRPNPISSPIG